MSVQKKRVKVQELPIRLGQFLKLAEIVQDGVEAKMRIQDGQIQVNRSIEIRRGKQLQHLDEVSFEGDIWVVDIEDIS